MIIWFALILPVTTELVMIFKFSKDLTPARFIINLLVPLAIIATIRYTTEYTQTRAVEYLGGYARQTVYYEPWDERVSCRHPIYCTGYTTDSKGVSHSYTYVCGHVHAYDVDYHPAYWEIDDSNKRTFYIAQAKFQELVTRWGGQTHFVDLHRNYHSINGNAYVGYWDKQFSTCEPTSVSQTYENRVQVSHSIFNFAEIDPKKSKVFEHPSINNYYQPVILGPIGPSGNDRIMGTPNALYGAASKARFYVLVWVNQPIQVAKDQQAYWKNGNKNEIVICTSVSSGTDISGYRAQWCYVFGWSRDESLKEGLRDCVMGAEVLQWDLVSIWLGKYLQEHRHFIRRDFREFKYLRVDPPMWAVWLTYILTLVVCVGMVVVEVWVDEDGSRGNFRRYPPRR